MTLMTMLVKKKEKMAVNKGFARVSHSPSSVFLLDNNKSLKQSGWKCKKISLLYNKYILLFKESVANW